MNQRIKITDLRDPRLDIYARLSEVQLLRYAEPAPGIFIGESPKVIRRALAAGYKPISFLVADLDLDGKHWRFWNNGRRFRCIQQRKQCSGN